MSIEHALATITIMEGCALCILVVERSSRMKLAGKAATQVVRKYADELPKTTYSIPARALSDVWRTISPVHTTIRHDHPSRKPHCTTSVRCTCRTDLTPLIDLFNPATVDSNSFVRRPERSRDGCRMSHLAFHSEQMYVTRPTRHSVVQRVVE